MLSFFKLHDKMVAMVVLAEKETISVDLSLSYIVITMLPALSAVRQRGTLTLTGPQHAVVILDKGVIDPTVLATIDSIAIAGNFRI